MPFSPGVQCRLCFQERKSQSLDDGSQDLLSHLLRAQQQQPEVMTDKQIRDELMTFIFAGSDTTATTLAFAMYELSRRPELQQQVAEEVQQVLAACPEGACPSSHALRPCAVTCNPRAAKGKPLATRWQARCYLGQWLPVHAKG